MAGARQSIWARIFGPYRHGDLQQIVRLDGGFIATDLETIDYIKHHSRPLIFSASMAPATVAAVLAALDIIEQEPERREQLWRNASRWCNGLRELGFNTGRLVTTPVVPVILGEDMLTFRFWRALFDRGVFTNPAVRQAVAPGSSYCAPVSLPAYPKTARSFRNFLEVGQNSKVIRKTFSQAMGDFVLGTMPLSHATAIDIVPLQPREVSAFLRSPGRSMLAIRIGSRRSLSNARHFSMPGRIPFFSMPQCNSSWPTAAANRRPHCRRHQRRPQSIPSRARWLFWPV